jgi:hypothetical protein
MALEIVVLVAGGIGLLMLGAGLRRLWRRRLVTGGLASLTGSLLLAGATLSGGVALNLYTYHRFTREQAAAELAFRALGPQHFRVQLRDPHGQLREFELRGDEWQLDARILKWGGPAVLLGFDTVYRLERLSGRYDALTQEQDGPRTVHSLAEGAGIDLWGVAHRHEAWLPWVDAIYGSATYLPMRDGARYAVTVSASGLVARPSDETDQKPVKTWN